MNRYYLTVRPHSSLFIGGYAHAQGESDGDTATDAEGMLIPGSTMKGALREAAVRLVNGAGRGHNLVTELFGEAENDGVLRVGPLRPAAASELPDLSLRHHVSLVRATRQAAPGRLFQNRVTAAGYDLCFHGEMTAARKLSPDEEALLEAARQITDQIGGGRGRGLGFMSLEMRRQDSEAVEESSRTRALESLDADEIVTVLLVLRAEEPLQLGGVKDLSNVAPSKDYLDGSAVRGAVASALVRAGMKDELEPILGAVSPVIFGNGYPGNAFGIPAPLTLREPKAGGTAVDDAVHLCAHAAGLPFSRTHDTRAAKGSFARVGDGWTRVRVRRRMVTRNARNLVDGRAAAGLLYSREVVEPILDAWDCDAKLRFYVPVRGRREQLEKVAEAASAGLMVGSTRSRGFGLLALEDLRIDTTLEDAEQRHRRFSACLTALGVSNAETTGVLLAVGPLAVGQDRLVRALEAHGLELVHGASRRQTHGGWNSKVRLPRTVASHFVPGSTFVVGTRDGSSVLGALTRIENNGIGPGRPDGWGRLIACHPIHVDCCKEDRS